MSKCVVGGDDVPNLEDRYCKGLAACSITEVKFASVDCEDSQCRGGMNH